MKKAAMLIGIWGLVAGATAQAQNFSGSEKLSPWVRQGMNQDSALPVLLVLTEKAELSPAQLLTTKAQQGSFVYSTLTQVASQSQEGLVKWLTARELRFERFYIVNMLALYDATPAVLRELAGRADVAKIIGNPSFSALPPTERSASFFDLDDNGIEAAIVSTGAKKVWDELNVKGENIVIAGQDTGVQWDHPAIKRQYRGLNGANVDHNYNWYDAVRSPIASGSNPCGLAIAAPCDDNGHGTHTIGSIVGQDGEQNQIGMAPEAKWMACRNMDQGDGRATTYIKCFEFFLAPFPVNGNSFTDGKPELAPHVINNSWGCPQSEGCQGAEMKEVLAALKAAGIVTVASAGNEGPSCGTIADQPASVSPLTLSVGAHDHRNGSIAVFSSRGPSALDHELGPDLSAPGVQIRSSVPNNRYQSFSGTSMAGPHTVGAVALLLSAKPALIGNVDGVYNVMKQSATPKTSNQSCGGVSGSQIPNNVFGYGYLDIYKAIKGVAL